MLRQSAAGNSSRVAGLPWPIQALTRVARAVMSGRADLQPTYCNDVGRVYTKSLVGNLFGVGGLGDRAGLLCVASVAVTHGACAAAVQVVLGSGDAHGTHVAGEDTATATHVPVAADGCLIVMHAHAMHQQQGISPQRTS
jgi:hypothetical protein